MENIMEEISKWAGLTADVVISNREVSSNMILSEGVLPFLYGNQVSLGNQVPLGKQTILNTMYTELSIELLRRGFLLVCTPKITEQFVEPGCIHIEDYILSVELIPCIDNTDCLLSEIPS